MIFHVSVQANQILLQSASLLRIWKYILHHYLLHNCQ